MKPNWRKPVPSATWNLSLPFLRSSPLARGHLNPLLLRVLPVVKMVADRLVEAKAFHWLSSRTAPPTFSLWAAPALGSATHARRGRAGLRAGRSSVSLSLLQPRFLCCSGAALPALAARGKGGDRRVCVCVCVRVCLCVRARGGRRGASSSPRAGRAARVSSSRRGPGRRHVGGWPMPGGSRRRPRGLLLPCGGLPWRGVHVPMA